jgi:CheY-like chemotaxis protein
VSDLPRIVVIEDDAAIREILQLALSGEGYEVREARNGEEGLALLARDGADLVLVDMKMPVMDGAEFCRVYALRPRPRARVIIMTAASQAVEAAALPGVIEAIAKPFELDELLEAVTRNAPRPA